MFANCNANEVLSDTKAITSFNIGDVEGILHEQTITVTVPHGTDITALAPVVLFEGSSLSPASGAAQDFTEPTTYRVTADDGSVRDYTVVVRHTAPNTKAITAFSIGSAVGILHEQTITVTVPYGTDLTALAPLILFTGSSVSPASEATQDFTDPVTYRVIAGDGSARDYTVTVQIKGQAPIKIIFTSLPYETVDLTLDSEKNLSRTQEDTLRITVTGTPARWFIDGVEQFETGDTVNIAAKDYPVGIHHVTALVYKDEIPYSDEATFRVVN
jgi:hypothetical protein